MTTNDNASAMWASASRSWQYLYWAQTFHNQPLSSNGQELEPPLPDPSPDHATAFLDAFSPAVASTACSLWEGSYVSQDRSGLFEELARFYEHFGLARSADAELPDHIAVELEFMHFLTYLENEMQRRGEDTEGILLAQRDFLSRHLLKLANAVQSNCRSSNPRIVAMTNRLKAFVTVDYACIRGISSDEPTAR